MKNNDYFMIFGAIIVMVGAFLSATSVVPLLLGIGAEIMLVGVAIREEIKALKNNKASEK